jgi:hypothetical protein
LSLENASEQGREKILKRALRKQKTGSSWKKDTFLTQQTYRSIENKGLSFFGGQKQTGF